MSKALHTKKIRDWALEMGFAQVGFSKSEELTEEGKKLEHWLAKGYQGQMKYLENHFDLRIDPSKLFPGAKTIVSFIYNYFPEQNQNPSAPKIARYAYGRDYHKVIKKKLKKLMFKIQEEIGVVNGRAFVDSAPIMEREWAKRSGLGWLGKNTLLIHPKKGSYYFLAELVIDLELTSDHPIKDHCGTCTKCIDACPTSAISPEGYVLDASKCISYFTIELKTAIPEEQKGKFDDWMFGCDICQEVCPWNRFSTGHKEPDFVSKNEKLDMDQKQWEEITEDIFNEIFQGSPVKRTGFEGLKRNISFLKK